MKYFLIILCLTGCYNLKKATLQHGKAVATYPQIGADYCARVYPPAIKLIKGDTVVSVDTFWTEGNTMYDTLRVANTDTVRIIKTIQLAGTKIIERTTIHDTVEVVNTAALDLARIELGKALTIATDKTKEADKWRKIAKKRFWVILGMGAVMVLGIVAVVRRKMRKVK